MVGHHLVWEHIISQNVQFYLNLVATTAKKAASWQINDIGINQKKLYGFENVIAQVHIIILSGSINFLEVSLCVCVKVCFAEFA